MKRVELKFRVNAFPAIRNRPKLLEEMARLSKEIVSEAGDGYKSATGTGDRRARSTIWTANYDAIKAESKNSNLLRILGSKRV